MNDFSFNVNNKYTPIGICNSIEKMTEDYQDIVIVFIGTDGNIGDSLAPLSSSLAQIDNGNIFVYGSLNNTITAKEVPFLNSFVRCAHPKSFVLVIDAAVGNKEDIGQIKVQKRGIKPGLGVNKDLPLMGNGAIIGVISEKSSFSTQLLTFTRLSIVYKMAKVISEGIKMFIERKTTMNKKVDIV